MLFQFKDKPYHLPSKIKILNKSTIELSYFYTNQ